MELTFLLNGQLRVSTYPDGISSRRDSELEDDENLSSVSLKLVRPIGDHVDVDLRYPFFYGGTPPTASKLLPRHLASAA